MADTYSLAPSQDAITDDYQQVFYWSLKDKPSRSLLLQMFAIPLSLLLGLAFTSIAIEVGKLPANFKPGTLEIGTPELGIFFASIIMTVVLHELGHGIAMRWCGARPHYGVSWKQLSFYTTSPGHRFRRNAYILVAVAPLVALSTLATLGMLLLQGTDWVALLALCAVLNGSGAVGDLWAVSIVLRYPRDAYVIDESGSIRVLMQQ